MTLRLGVNIDHVATIRNARGGPHPDPVRAAKAAIAAGADGITAHLREDRRHISDDDIARIAREIDRPLNFEMAATEEMVAIAERHRPHAACLVPEKREERTTEGGLDVIGQHNTLVPVIARLTRAGCRVSLFVEPDPRVLDAASAVGAPVVELHTGAYAHAEGAAIEHELNRLRAAATHAARIGLECHAGHGLTYENVSAVAAIPELVELNIGHFLIGEAIFSGLDSAIRRMRMAMDAGRRAAGKRPGVIIGLGSDMVDIRRIERTLERFGERFTSRLFTEIEQARAERRRARAETYAKRFAAKEACAKALGTGLRRGVFWRDMGVVNLPGGRPTMQLTGGAAQRLRDITPPGHQARIDVSITDEYPLAQVTVLISAVPNPHPAPATLGIPSS